MPLTENSEPDSTTCCRVTLEVVVFVMVWLSVAVLPTWTFPKFKAAGLGGRGAVATAARVAATGSFREFVVAAELSTPNANEQPNAASRSPNTYARDRGGRVLIARTVFRASHVAGNIPEGQLPAPGFANH